MNLWNAVPDGIVGCKMINNFVTKPKCAELVKFLKVHAWIAQYALDFVPALCRINFDVIRFDHYYYYYFYYYYYYYCY